MFAKKKKFFFFFFLFNFIFALLRFGIRNEWQHNFSFAFRRITDYVYFCCWIRVPYHFRFTKSVIGFAHVNSQFVAILFLLIFRFIVNKSFVFWCLLPHSTFNRKKAFIDRFQKIFQGNEGKKGILKISKMDFSIDRKKLYVCVYGWYAW